MGVTEASVIKRSNVAREQGFDTSGAALYSESKELRTQRKVGIHWPHAAMRAAVDQKALDVRALDISQTSDIADYFLICSGTSERHVKGIADKLQADLARYGERPISVTGYQEGEWIVLDYGDLVIHVFYEPMRQHYGLDELWGARSTEILPPADLQDHMRMLRTGIIW